ncbi:CAMK/RAD53 protein kinase [Diplocarpon mali]|nr:CAMK/RAD53 protein kinase [Diplocarpon mali]
MPDPTGRDANPAGPGLATKILMWIYFAKRPLLAAELPHALAAQDLHFGGVQNEHQHHTRFVVGFLENRNLVLAAIQASRVPQQGNRYFEWEKDYPRDVPALVYAASFGICLETHPGSLNIDVNIANIRGVHSVLYLLDQGADINGKGSDHRTAILAASGSGHANVVLELIKRGANLEAKDLAGETALAAASRNGHSVVQCKGLYRFERRLQLDATLACSTDRTSVIDLAMLSENREIRLLLSHSAAQMLDQTKPHHASQSKNLADLRPARQTRFSNDCRALMAHLQNPSPLGKPASAVVEDTDLHLSLFRPLFALGNECGKGSFSQVHGCRHRASGLHYCAKMATNPGCMKSIVDEFRLLRRLKHDNIIRVKGIFLTASSVSMVTELALHGDFCNYVVAKQKLSDAKARACFTQIFGAIKYLSKYCVISIFSPSSLAITTRHAWPCPYKIITMKALAETMVIQDGNRCPMKSAKDQTVRLRASVEGDGRTSLKMERFHVRKPYSHDVALADRSDMAPEMFTGGLPFSDSYKTEKFPYNITEQILGARYKLLRPNWGVEYEAVDLITRMLTVDAKQRNTIGECLTHPWMDSRCEEAHEVDEDGKRASSLRRRSKVNTSLHLARRAKLSSPIMNETSLNHRSTHQSENSLHNALSRNVFLVMYSLHQEVDPCVATSHANQRHSEGPHASICRSPRDKLKTNLSVSPLRATVRNTRLQNSTSKDLKPSSWQSGA